MSELSEKIKEVGRNYLGFAADRYMERQCKIHMDKSLEDLEKSDLDEFSRWIKNTAPLITDQETSRKLRDELLDLKK